MQVGTKEIPDELFYRYLKLIKYTERSSERYNYDFDERRQSVHQEILDYLGLMVHMNEYREFDRALQDLCEEMLPPRFKKIKPCKITTPVRGLR